MKKVLFLMAMMIGISSAWAYDYPYLTMQSTDGTVKSISVESLTLTISDGQLIAVNENGTQTFILSQLSKMYFSKDATRIENLNDENAEGLAESIYDLSGRKVSPLATPSSLLKKGIYVIRQNGVTRKIAVK